MMKKLTFLFFLLMGMANAQIIKNVDAAAFKKLIDDKKGELIDLRTPAEISAKGKIKGAQEIDYLAKDIDMQLSKLDKKKTYLIYCAGGGRSGDCALIMQKMGFAEVINLEKGFGDWKNRGFDIEKK